MQTSKHMQMANKDIYIYKKKKKKKKWGPIGGWGVTQVFHILLIFYLNMYTVS